MGERMGVFGLRKDGEEFPAEAAISKIHLEGMRLFTVVLRDVTERVRLEREQRFLAEVGAVLTSTLDYEETPINVAKLVVRELADVCIVETVEEGDVLRRLKGHPS